MEQSRVGLYFFRSNQKTGNLGFRRNSVTYHTYFLSNNPYSYRVFGFSYKKVVIIDKRRN